MSFTATSDGRSSATIAADGPPDFGKFILEGIPYTYDPNTEPVLATGESIPQVNSTY